MKVCFFCHDSVSWWRGILLPLWQISFHRNSWVRGKKTELKQNKEKGCEIKENWTKKRAFIWRIVQQMQEMWSSVQCETVCSLWMGRQVLYEWRGSCDRSTSQSRYFSLTVNTHTRNQPIKTIPLPKPRNGRDEHKNGSYAEHETDLRVFVMRPSVRDALYKRCFLWMKAVICKWEWLRKKRHLELFHVDVAAIDPKRLFVEGNRT